MNNSKINDKFIDIVCNNKEEYFNDYKKLIDMVSNSSAIYQGEPIPFLYHPLFITKKEIEDFKYITSTLMGILKKVIDNYIKSPAYRKKFGFSKTLEDLILIDPGYDYNIPMGRFDVFYNNSKEFKFCELNTDGSSAMNETNVLERLFLESKAIEKLKEKYEINYRELVYKWVDESIEVYNSWDKKRNRRPNVAILDFEGGKTVNEFMEFKKAYIERGYKAEIVDPRRVKYLDGKLFYKDMEIDLVYRRLVTSDLMKRIDEVPDFVEAYRNNAACFVGPIRSQIAHNKIIFKVLHDEDTLNILEDTERDFIKHHIPFTQALKDNKNYEEFLNNKDKYIIKPNDLYASKGVYAGADLSFEEWKLKLDECMDKDYLIQEFIKPYTQKFIKFSDDGEMEIKELKHIIGLYMYKEEFAGLYTRVSSSNIISSLYNCYTVPNLILNY